MTENGNTTTDTPPAALPTIVVVSKSFASRMPSQRVIDTVRRLEGGAELGLIADSASIRLQAFRALMRDFPDYDPTTLWLHAYDVEVEIADVDPTPSGFVTGSPPSATTGDVSPTTLTS